MKKLWRGLLRAALALVLLAVALSYGVYGRSVQASVYELWLRRHFATRRTAETEVARLRALRETDERGQTLPAGVDFISAVREADFDGMRVFTLNGGAGGALVLYLHGGAYINGINAYQCRFMDRLAIEADCAVVAPAYHLAPWGDCARAYDDLLKLYRALLSENPGRRIVLMGDSAGGGLALGLAEALAAAGDALPERLILFSPWVDVSMENPDIEDYVPVEPILHLELVKVHGRYWANGDTRHWQASPLYGDMTGLPSVTVFVGTRELLSPDIRLACDKLAASGVPVDLRVGRGLNHDYPLMPIPEGRAAANAAIALVRG